MLISSRSWVWNLIPVGSWLVQCCTTEDVMLLLATGTDVPVPRTYSTSIGHGCTSTVRHKHISGVHRTWLACNTGLDHMYYRCVHRQPRLAPYVHVEAHKSGQIPQMGYQCIDPRVVVPCNMIPKGEERTCTHTGWM